MKSTDITNAYLGNNEVTALYMGSNLIFQKNDKPVAGNILSGKVSEVGEYSIKFNDVDYPITLNDDLTFELEYPKVIYSCYNMMNNCRNIQEIYTMPDTSMVSNMQNMFFSCQKLTTIPDFDTGNVENMIQMFYSCSKLNIKKFNFDTSKVTSMSGMFRTMNGIKITELDLSTFNTGNVVNMSNMFNTCSQLTTLHLGNNFDMSKVTDVTNMFFYANNLTYVTGHISGISIDLKLNSCSKLTGESAMVFINGLAECESVSRTLTLRNTTYNELTNNQIAIASERGWSVVSSSSIF